ncbi:ABC transporter substrate-binding protein [Alkalihalobacillus sp. CinArs1]|uniref:ABC transporter substrate-binding protein n=1 Tax=Alkalihalobacillus sp. CinArs1 TaxID=2995314 RepID=UPI0022DE27D2|nr:ABC transporter substrate-binding protein [Alkalihalobacillus sp. CinArs1]
MRKIIMLITLVLVLVAATACSESSKSVEGSSSDGKKEIAVIVKATDSDFWQTVLQGAEKAAEDQGDKVNVTTYGPPSEADIDKQIAILENVISQNPDGIVIASTSSDASVPGIEKAMDKGIPVVLVDNRVNTEKFVSFLATDNVKGGALGAEQFVENLEAQGKELKGKVAIISAMAGVQVLIDRDKGFIDRLEELAPDIEPLEVRYVDNDITKALGAAEDLLTSHPDLLGFFADNNHTGIGVARAITERDLIEEVPVIAYDGDKEEINALKSGAIDALIVQDPFGMGYEGVNTVLKDLSGESTEQEIDTGATIVTMENFDEDEIQKLLYPDKR